MASVTDLSLDVLPQPDDGTCAPTVVAAAVERGSLARRLVRAVGDAPAGNDLREMAGGLCVCLDTNVSFPSAGRNR